ncbi:MAG: ArsR/SmtB family transcription factor [Planctomycetota bacterium]|jgi:ArsR family transcriptional regulator
MSDLDQYATVFKALADPLRLRLLSMLPNGQQKRSFCVCELAEKLGVSQPCLSHHLNILKTAGLVGFEKDGCSVFYFLAEAQVLEKLSSFRYRLQQR